MKRVLCVAAFLALAAGLPLWAYDTSPGPLKVVPEAVWAAATGGGTWVTELQITGYGYYTAAIDIHFAYAGGIRGPIRVHPGLSQFSSVRFSNILSQLQTLDPPFSYYGRVGALWISTVNSNSRIQVQAKTVNGN